MDNLKFIFDHYKICDIEEIIKYIDSNKRLITSLVQGMKKIKEIFGVDVVVELKVFETLFGHIFTFSNYDDAFSKLDKFDSEWYLKQSDEILELLNFTIGLKNG